MVNESMKEMGWEPGAQDRLKVPVLGSAPCVRAILETRSLSGPALFHMNWRTAPDVKKRIDEERSRHLRAGRDQRSKSSHFRDLNLLCWRLVRRLPCMSQNFKSGACSITTRGRALLQEGQTSKVSK